MNAMRQIDPHATALTKARYDRNARLYDLIEGPMELLAFRRWREKLWAQVPGGRVLEVGRRE